MNEFVTTSESRTVTAHEIFNSNTLEKEKYSLAVKEKDNGYRYSWEYLSSLPDIEIVDVLKSGFIQLEYSPELTRSDIISTVRENIKMYNDQKENHLGDKKLYSNGLKNAIEITSEGLKHGLRKLSRSNNNISATINIPAMIENAIVINETSGERNSADKGFVLVGVYKKGSELFITRFTINHYTNELEDVDVMYAMTSKKEDAANESAPDDLVTSSTLKVTSLLDVVNKYYKNQLSKDVLEHYGMERDEKTDIEGIKYSLNIDREGQKYSTNIDEALFEALEETWNLRSRNRHQE